ncbi:hypothetical protein Slin14017_G130170 [Septoria linicola]|nr:hypothetical protein Slin14017_G130170 [Septoria linicola]
MNKKKNKPTSKKALTIANAATPSDMDRPADFLDYLVGAWKYVSHTLPNKIEEVKQEGKNGRKKVPNSKVEGKRNLAKVKVTDTRDELKSSVETYDWWTQRR